MAVNYLSPHPSNPLEVGSSDVFNKAYKAQLGIGAEVHSDRLSEFVGGYASDSDDPLREIPKMEEYQSHIADVTGFKVSEMQQDTRYIDLDEGLSDDELQEGYGQDDTPRAARTRRAMRYVLEDEEDGGEEMDEVEEEEGEGEGGEVHKENDEEHDDLDVHPTSDDIDCFALDESEEEATLKLKPIDEQLEIQHEIQDFKNAVPMLGDDYKLIDRLGTGTFSSVYKAIDLRYHEWDNSPWLGHHPPASSAHYQSVPKPPGSRVFVAIKRIYVTSGPERIKNELLLMELCRGCRHVSQLITAFRHEDQVAIVMPYHRNEDFREYFMELPMPGIKEYFRCLLRALRDIHARHIIHRDVKPANFLFDPRTGQGSLCDFGLAQRFDSKAPAHGACLHITMSKDDAHGKYRTKSEYNSDWVRSQQVAARKKSKTRSEFVGYPDKDQRVPMKANRAGTRGFRAPEVLFKCGQQNGAVDIWSAGIILLFFLTRKFPLFQANDDIEALMELATILGKTVMEKVATLHCRIFSSNVPSIQSEVTWKTFAEKLNPELYNTPAPNPKFYPYTLPSQKAKLVLETEAENSLAGRIESPPAPEPSTSKSKASSSKSESSPAPSWDAAAVYKKDVAHALDLLEKLLHPESVKRITPEEALKHPFLAERGAREKKYKGDNGFFPHPFGNGVCGDMHFVDPVTDQPGVIRGGDDALDDGWEETRRLVLAGEGLAIGNDPCEFHKDYDAENKMWLS
ncbi:kinase-like protein [Ephemerocybe angulata]|uniref:non-specific serine/threonine protein kinase n=1 Tax=Ephemerocybe angulata TaxID=980116 RepID=A0A8H6HKX7_9AGAR|nr:kinase-like protein [Tulosesus angulatus]